MCINCLYLGLKLFEVISFIYLQRIEDNIMTIAKHLKTKPKHSLSVHYGDEGYGAQELSLCEALNFEIQVP